MERVVQKMERSKDFVKKEYTRKQREALDGGKSKMICAHCRKFVIWYRKFIYETDYAIIDKKTYCFDCRQKIALQFVSEAME